MKKSDSKRLAIINSAMEMIMEQGYAKVSVELICRKNGITKPTFYKYVRAKEMILVHHFEEAMEAALAKARENLDQGKPVQALGELLASMNYTASEVGPELYRVYWNYVLKERNTTGRALPNVHSSIVECLETLQKEGLMETREEPKKLAMVLMDISEGLGISWAGNDGGFDLMKTYCKIVHAILRIGCIMEPWICSDHLA